VGIKWPMFGGTQLYITGTAHKHVYAQVLRLCVYNIFSIKVLYFTSFYFSSKQCEGSKCLLLRYCFY
jgi:hypothetical protein